MFVISKVSIHRFFCLCKFFINSQRIVPYFLDTTTWSLCHWFLSLAIRIILKRLISKAILLMEWILHQWTRWISHSLQWFDNQVVSLMQLPSTVSCAPWWNCWLPKHLKIALHWVWFTVKWRSHHAEKTWDPFGTVCQLRNEKTQRLVYFYVVMKNYRQRILESRITQKCTIANKQYP